jgi:MerR family transcriptional regulator, copper efflux regulator
MSNESSPCGCSSACAPSTEPIVCTLAGRQEQETRLAEFRDVFVHLARTEPLEGTFRWFFRDAPGLEPQLRELARRENECCRFFDFRIQREGDFIVWEVRAPEDAAAVLEELRRLPETISASTPETMKRVFSEAGLTFVSGAEKKTQ